MKTPTRLAAVQSIPNFRLAVVAFLAMLLTFGGSSPMTLAAPGMLPTTGPVSGQNVDWLSADAAASLDLPMDVLVPTWVPAPFDAVAPSITASGGYYQLYWMVTGGPPTFLYIEGTVGGALPAGSPADLNKELSINASVQGWNAIHDLGIPAGTDTPIYDQVWWMANGALYTVSSNNMTGTDTMSLANSLVVLQPPYVVPAPTDPPLPTEPPYVEPAAPSGNDTQEPVSNTGAGNGVSNPGGNAADTSAGNAAQPEVSSTNTGEGTSDNSGAATSNGASGNDQSWSPGRYDGAVPSDGTNGPLPPLIGSDGTGGAFDTALPNIFLRP